MNIIDRFFKKEAQRTIDDVQMHSEYKITMNVSAPSDTTPEEMQAWLREKTFFRGNESPGAFEIQNILVSRTE